MVLGRYCPRQIWQGLVTRPRLTRHQLSRLDLVRFINKDLLRFIQEAQPHYLLPTIVQVFMDHRISVPIPQRTDEHPPAIQITVHFRLPMGRME